MFTSSGFYREAAWWVASARRRPVPAAIALGAVALLLAGCAALFPASLDGPPQVTPTRTARGAAHAADATGHYAVATAHPAATRAAALTLERGGSAADAVVAASLVLSVATPQSTGIGGGGLAVVVPRAGNPVAVDFRETAPAATRLADYLDDQQRHVAARSQHHGLAVAVPGYVAGLWELHQRWGRRPWAELVDYAIVAAEQGTEVTPQLAKAIALQWPTLNPAAQAVFGPRGTPLAAGDRLVWRSQGATLRAIAENPQAFYGGAIAQELAAAAQGAGGRLTVADLQAYTVRVGPALSGTLFGHQALTVPAPSAGGAQLLAMDSWFSDWQGTVAGTRPYTVDAGFATHALVEAMRRSFVLRLAYSSDVPKTVLDDVFPCADRQALGASFVAGKATPTGSLPHVGPPPTAAPALERHENTSHVSVVDREGMAIAVTHTVNLLLGSGIMTAQGGVLLNNEMDDFSYTTLDHNAFGLAGSAANLARPLARPVSSMTPMVLMQGPAHKPGKPWMVVGSPGGTRIPTTVLQVIFRVAVLGQDLDMAVAAPRVHHQALPDAAWVEEGGEADAVAQALSDRGHAIQRKPAWCNVQAIVRQDESEGRSRWIAVSDPRGEGAAVAK